MTAAPSGRDGRWRRQRLADAYLYLCTDRRATHGDLEGFLEAVLPAGVDLVQLRDKEADEGELRDAAAVFRAAAERHDALFILNDDPWLAAEAGADGVHVGQEDVPPDEVRAVVGDDRVVGRSTHSPEQFDQGLREDADYLAIGPVHATPTKEGRPPIGLEPVRHAAAVAGARPWFVTGAMDSATAPSVLAAGARRVVVVRAVTESADPGRAAREIATLLREGSV